MEQNRITLSKGEILTRKKGVCEIVCLEGNLWITCKGCISDIVLGAGEHRELNGFRDICVQAFEKSCLTIETGKPALQLRRAPGSVRIAEI